MHALLTLGTARTCAIMLLAMLPAPSSEGPSPAGRCGSECVEHVSEAGSANEPPPSLEPSFVAWPHASLACSPAGRQRITLHHRTPDFAGRRRLSTPDSIPRSQKWPKLQGPRCVPCEAV